MSGWSAGSYEHTAVRLEPVAGVVLDELEIPEGGAVLDVACGTGNAALEAARRGFAATGVDSAERLVTVARERAAAEGLDARFDEGDAADLPYPDASFDAVVSVFGVIFADPEQAAAELLRVTRPGGVIAVTTWVPGGAAGKVMDLVREAFGQTADPPRWSSHAFVTELFAPHRVSFARREIAFTAASPAAYKDEQTQHHPLWKTAAEALENADRLDEVLARIDALFAEANEDPSAFRTTSEYDVVTVAR